MSHQRRRRHSWQYRAASNERPVFFSRRIPNVWVHIISGAIQMALESWMQMSEWLWFE